MRKRFWIGFLGLLIAFMGALPWLQPQFSILENLPSGGEIYSGIIFVLGAIIFLWEVFKSGY